MELAGRVALVTGSGRRVGRSIARALAARGADLVVHYRGSQAEAAAAVAEFEAMGRRAVAVQADLKVVAQVEALAAAAEAFGPVDVLVNSASTFYPTPLGTVTEAQWDDLVDANLKGWYFLAQALGPRMKARGHGKIVNICDWAVIRPYADYDPYICAKAGVLAMTKALAKALAPQVQVNAVSPGPVLLPEDMGPDDEAQILKRVPLKRVGSPEDIAGAVAFLVEGGDYMTGSNLFVDGGSLIG